jgi:hypothetical protein
MVFKDGIYMIEDNCFLKIDFNYFLSNSDIFLNESNFNFDSFMEKICDDYFDIDKSKEASYLQLYNLLKDGNRTFFVFEESFKYLKYQKKKPHVWLKTLEEQLVDKTELEDLIFDLSKYFHQSFDLKKNSLATVIDGPSNSLKTSLIGNLIKSAFGLSNVGVIVKSDNFAFQDLTNKKMIFVNEYAMGFNTLSNLLDISAGEGTKVQVKFKNPQLLEKILPILFITMNFDQQLGSLKKYNEQFYKALINRFKIFKFKNVNRTENEFKLISKEIKKEFPLILLYCFEIFRKRKHGDTKLLQ